MDMVIKVSPAEHRKKRGKGKEMETGETSGYTDLTNLEESSLPDPVPAPALGEGEVTVSGNSPTPPEGEGNTGTGDGNEGNTETGEPVPENPGTGDKEPETNPGNEQETGNPDDILSITVPEPVVIREQYVPEELTGSIEGLISILQEERETEPVSTWKEGATQWTVTFLNRTISVYSFEETEQIDTERYYQASDGNWIAGNANLPLYEEYLFYLSGEVSASGIRVFGSDGGYPEDFIQCSDGCYVLMDDSAAYEEWLLQKEQEEETELARLEHEDAVLACLEQENGYLAAISGNSIDLIDSNAMQHEEIITSLTKLQETLDTGLGFNIAGVFILGIIAGISVMRIFWDRMRLG